MNKLITKPQLYISANALRKNYEFLRDIVAPSNCAAVVKDNAYGLGAEEVVRILYEAGCKTFFVAYAFEAEIIRAKYSDVEIFILHGPSDCEIELINKLKLIPVISTLAQLEFWNKFGDKNIAPAIQIETGLNRLGFSLEEIKSEEFKKNIPQKIKLIMSHLSCANDEKHFLNKKQLTEFKKIVALLPKAKLSIAASDGVFLGKDFHFDLVRCGAAIYGLNTTLYRENQMQAVVTVNAPIMKISTLAAENFVGYGATFATKKNNKIATISIGYGNGLPRQLHNKGKVWFYDANKKSYAAKIVGAVSMDMITVDVSDVPDELVSVGKMVSIVDDYYTVDDLAKDAGTIGYEILIRFAAMSAKLIQ